MKRSLVAWVVFCALALVAPATAQRALSAAGRPVVRRPRLTFPAPPGARKQTFVRAASLGQGGLSAVGYDAFGQATIPAEAQSHIRTLVAGDVHSLALRTDGTVVAWGDNSAGQAAVPAGLTGVRAIGAGAYHSLAVKDDGTVVAWGGNNSGQTAVPAGLTHVTAVVGGSECSAALRSDGTVVVWGANDRGQRNVPAGLTGVKALAAGAGHLLALKTDGTVVAWGGNNSGQATVPPGLSGVVSIAAGYFHSIALKADGTIRAWGDNSVGQGNVAAVSGVRAIASTGLHSVALTAAGTLVGSGDNSFGQVTVQGFSGVGQVACGAGHTLVLRTVAGARVWGDNASGQLSVPTGLGAVSTVAAGSAHCLALESTGSVAAWGANQIGQATVPQGLLGVTSIAAGADFSLALKHDGTIVPWGGNAAGQTTLPGGLLGVRAVAAGADFGLALRADGTVTAWGGNDQGQATIPGDLAGVIEIAAGAQHALALKSDGTVTAWGRNQVGQATVPPGLADVMAIAAGGDHSLALQSDGTVVAWGEDAAEVPDTLSGVIAITAGAGPCLALQSNGTIVTWGDDLGGLLAPPPGLIGISAVSLGGAHGMAVLSPAPFVGVLAPLATLEDQPTSVITIHVGDLDTPVGDLTLTAVATPPGKVQSFELGGSGAVRTLRIIPAPNANGTVNVVVTASDGTFTGGASFPLTITPVNDPPTFTRGADPVVAEDSGPQTFAEWAGGVSGGPADEATQTGTFFVTANTRPDLFVDAPAVNSFTGDLTFTPEENAHGTATITLRLRDDGGTANGGINFSVQTFTITITPVNDPPVPTGDSYAVPYSNILSVSGNGVLGNDTDLDGDALTAAVAVGPTHGSLVLNANGSFIYRPVVGYSGPDSFTYTVSDGTVQSEPVTVTLEVGTLPASTPNARVTGSGKVVVEGVPVKFTVQASNKRKLTGKLTFADRAPARKVKKATVTAVVVTGRHARVYGTATLGDGATSPFVADLDDPTRGTGPDRFGLELGTGVSVPSTALSAGKITIKP